MNRNKLHTVSVLLIALTVLLLPLSAKAFGVYRNPAITVDVLHASGNVDVQVTMQRHDHTGDSFNAKIHKDRRVWETLFRIYRDDIFDLDAWFGNSYDFEGAVLTARDGGRTWTIPIPYDQLKVQDYDDYLILDMNKGTLTVGVPVTRSILLAVMHLMIYLLVEGLILHLVGIRSRRSWKIFLLYTIPTKGIICFITRTWVNCDPRAYLAFAVASIFYLMFDLAFLTMLMDNSKDKIGKFAAAGNLLAALAVYWSFLHLPM